MYSERLLEEGRLIAETGQVSGFNLSRRWRGLHKSQRAFLFTLFTTVLLVTFWFAFAPNYQINLENGPVYKPESKLLFSVEPQLYKGPANDRQKAVVQSFQHAWTAYRTFAWGYDELNPVLNSSIVWFGLQLTIVDSLDTIILMGLENEYKEARDKIAADLKFDVDRYVSLFEVTIRVLGGLLTAYHLTGDTMFLTKATELGDRLMPAFKSPTGFPYSDINLKTGHTRIAPWTSFTSLSEMSTLQLEFRELTYLTGDQKYENVSFHTSKLLHNIKFLKYEGLYPMFYDIKTGKPKYGESIMTLGARSDSFYEYLFKQWLQTGKRISWLNEDFKKSMRAIMKYLCRRSLPNKLLFIGEILIDDSFSPKMDHLVCYIAGTLALAVMHGYEHEFMLFAKDLADTCYAMYKLGKTGLGPEIVHFNTDPNKSEDMNIFENDRYSLLRPEAVEAWFYLYRLTNDSKYQDWGWELLQAIEKHAKVPSGYCSVEDVTKVPTVCRPKMESFLLAETFKYLYLLFDSSKTLLPLDKYVFNTEAHPFPIRSGIVLNKSQNNM